MSLPESTPIVSMVNEESVDTDRAFPAATLMVDPILVKAPVNGARVYRLTPGKFGFTTIYIMLIMLQRFRKIIINNNNK